MFYLMFFILKYFYFSLTADNVAKLCLFRHILIGCVADHSLNES